MFNTISNNNRSVPMNHKPSALARDTTKQEPAPASSKAMWIEAKQLLPGDVIVRLHRVDSCPQHDVVTRDNVDEVKFGWWCRAYVLANGSHDVLTFREDERLLIERGPLFHIEAVNKQSGARERLTRYPMTRQQCETNATKISCHSSRRIELVEVKA
ncbi:hypothetical protein [Xanthomonas hortorum]